MKTSLLVAVSENNVIGKDNKLPWHLPADLKYFKNLTWGMPILMGRKTFDSIGKPLPGRQSIVITRNKDWGHEDVTVVHSLEEAVAAAADFGAKEIFVIGGAEIFAASLPQADRIYVTRIYHSFEGDVFFPELNETEWGLQSERRCEADEKDRYNHSFQMFERVRSLLPL